MELKNKYAKGGEFKEDTPKIYVADLKSYNEGKLIGEWVDLTDYDSGEEVQDKIDSLMKEYSEKYHDGEETEPAIHDYENFDSSLYSEYMGKADYDIIIDTRKISEEKGIPAEVLQSISNDFSPDNLEEFVDDRYIGEYDGDYELGENYVDNVGGIEGVKNSEFYFDYEALGRDLSINNYNEYDGHYFQNYKKGGKVKEYDLSKYAKGGSLDKDLSGNYTSTDDFVYEHGLLDLAKEKFGDDWESGGDYDYDIEEIKLLSGGDYKIIYVDSERQNRDNFEEAKQKYFPKIKRKSNDGDIFVVRSMEKGGTIEERVFQTDKYGEVSVRNAMFDIDGTNLEEGIEIKGDDIELTEIMQYYDVDELNIEEVEELLEKYEGNELSMNDEDDYYTEEYAKGGEIEERVYAIDMRADMYQDEGFFTYNQFKRYADELSDDEFMDEAETQGLVWSSMDKFLDSNEYNEEGDNLNFREMPVKMMVAKEYVNPDFLEKGGVVNLYFGDEREGQVRDVNSAADAARLAKKEGAEHYEFVPSSYEKGGEVKKKENNSMLIGGLAGILLGIFLGRR